MKNLTFILTLSFFALLTPYTSLAENRSVDRDDYYTNEVKPLFDSRCVVCHACMDAPCNLLMSSFEGVSRGGHNYDPYAVNAFGIKMQRLGIDATTVEGWRQRGFHAVVDQSTDSSPEERVNNSLLIRFVELAAANNKPGDIYAVERPLNSECPKNVDEFDKLFKNSMISSLNPFSPSLEEKKKYSNALGMPFGLLPLEASEIDKLKTWVRKGAPGPTETTIKALSTVKRPDLVKTAEDFFNAGHDIRNQDEEKANKHLWTARYLYEHLSSTRLYHDESPGDYFMMVRSATREGPIKEIVTEMAYDDPKQKFWYRLKKYNRTIVQKNLITYAVNQERFLRVSELFVETPWPIEKSEGGPGIPPVTWKDPNPFVSFAHIPPKIRYTWLIENSKLLIDAVTLAAACYGGVATYAVRDYFWVMFLDPDSDISVTMPGFFDQKSGSKGTNGDLTISELLMLPAFYKTTLKNPGYFTKRLREYEKLHAKLIAKRFPDGFSEKDIWDGIEKNSQGQTTYNKNAFLTIYRHTQSVSAHYGRMGNTPKTAMMFDYPLMQRLYYDISAAMNIYGSIALKFQARIYMEHLRREGEDLFLAFLPQKMREPVRKSWYKKDKQKPDKKPFFFANLYSNVDIKYAGPNSRPAILGYDQPEDLGAGGYENAGRQFMRRMTDLVFNPGVVGYPDVINDHNFRNTTFTGELPKTMKETNQSTVWKNLNSFFTLIADQKKPFVQFFPNVSYITIIQPDGKEPLYFTVIANKSHKSMNVIFGEKQTRDPQNDTLHIVPDLVISHPNMFFEFPLEKTPDFIRAVLAMREKADYEQLEETYGVGRANPKFWPYFDRLQAHFVKEDNIFHGVLDLNRFGVHQLQ